MFRVQGSGFGVQGLGLRVQGSGLRVEGTGLRVQGSGFGKANGQAQREVSHLRGLGFRIEG